VRDGASDESGQSLHEIALQRLAAVGTRLGLPVDGLACEQLGLDGASRRTIRCRHGMCMMSVRRVDDVGARYVDSRDTDLGASARRPGASPRRTSDRACCNHE
jgi:hypothetical protein